MSQIPAPVVFSVESLDKQTMLKLDRPALMREWAAAKEQLSLYKDFESTLRKEVVTGFVGDYVPKGTYHVAIGNGYFLKAQGTLNFKVDEAQIEATRAIFKEKAPTVIFDDLIKWKPELVEAAYNKLTAEERALMGACLSITRGTPQMEICKPKRTPGNILTEMIRNPDVENDDA